ncbi:hypothetical protein FRC08_015734 [Ceratobasidium sp. 394]|nr:hypothetical protein FRC08_015734 [Ceratobasidium sp. 394]KAG9083498.1 hypothetical protein FS749_005983 [Ceratobasidium sp. UAMH 11750]
MRSSARSTKPSCRASRVVTRIDCAPHPGCRVHQQHYVQGDLVSAPPLLALLAFRLAAAVGSESQITSVRDSGTPMGPGWQQGRKSRAAVAYGHIFYDRASVFPRTGL